MKHRQHKSGTGKTSLSSIMSTLGDKGVQPKHRHTAQTPEVVEDADEVARVVAANPVPEEAPPPAAAAEETGLTAEEEFRRRRQEARQKVREGGS